MFIFNFCCRFFSDNNQRTALHLAAMKGSKRCTRYILESHPQCVNLFDKNQVKTEGNLAVSLIDEWFDTIGL